MRKVMIQDMTWREVERRLRECDIAIIPIGSTEIHGPHLPLGNDAFIALVVAKCVVEETGGVVLPPIALTFSGATKPFPGSISIPLSVMAEYIKAVCLSLIEHGFKRTLLIQHHAPYIASQLVVRTIFEETGVPVVLFAPCIDRQIVNEIFKGFDGHYIEAALLAGALKILGRNDLLSQLKLEEIKKDAHVKLGPHSLTKIFEAGGTVGYFFTDETQHVAPRANISPEKGELVIKKSAEKITSIMGPWKEYVKVARDLGKLKRREGHS